MKETDADTIAVLKKFSKYRQAWKKQRKVQSLLVIWLDQSVDDAKKLIKKHELTDLPFCVVNTDDERMKAWHINPQARHTVIITSWFKRKVIATRENISPTNISDSGAELIKMLTAPVKTPAETTAKSAPGGNRKRQNKL